MGTMQIVNPMAIGGGESSIGRGLRRRCDFREVIEKYDGTGKSDIEACAELGKRIWVTGDFNDNVPTVNLEDPKQTPAQKDVTIKFLKSKIGQVVYSAHYEDAKTNKRRTGRCKNSEFDVGIIWQYKNSTYKNVGVTEGLFILYPQSESNDQYTDDMWKNIINSFKQGTLFTREYLENVVTGGLKFF